MKKYTDFWEIIIGPGPVGAFLAFIVISYICAFVSLLVEANNRDLQSPNSPVKFSWKFMLMANLNRIIGNLMLVPIAVRIFYPKMAHEAMVLTAVGIGICFDRIFMWLKNKGAALFSNADLAAKAMDKVAPTDLKIDQSTGK